MIRRNLLSKKDILRHSIFWALIAVFSTLVDPVSGSVEAKVIGEILIMSIYIIAYYFMNLFVFKKFLENRYILLVVWIAISIVIFVSALVFIVNFILPNVGGENQHYPIRDMAANSILIFSFIFFSALGNYLNRLGTEKLKLQFEKEKVLMFKELNFLKSQFNSHITFNFLNFCYSHVHQSSEKAAEAIELFSDMLRYSLKIKPDENVPLSKEVEYIENFISLQKHLTSKVFVDFKFQNLNDTKFILPRILITFVENAFKHGISNDPDYPIEINLQANSDNIIFKVKNRKNRKENLNELGVGQQNVKQILDSFYKQTYHLDINEDATNYYCELTLNI